MATLMENNNPKHTAMNAVCCHGSGSPSLATTSLPSSFHTIHPHPQTIFISGSKFYSFIHTPAYSLITYPPVGHGCATPPCQGKCPDRNTSAWLPPLQSKVVIIKLYIEIFWLPLLMRLMTYLCPAKSSGLATPLLPTHPSIDPLPTN